MLKSVREKTKISQSELAKQFGTTQSTIARVETYQAPLSVDLFDKYRKKFGMLPVYYYIHCKNYERIRQGLPIIQGIED